MQAREKTLHLQELLIILLKMKKEFLLYPDAAKEKAVGLIPVCQISM